MYSAKRVLHRIDDLENDAYVKKNGYSVLHRIDDLEKVQKIKILYY